MNKIRRRILPLVFLLYVVAFLDRANVAYAKLTMSPELGFSEAVYGFGAGLFFVGYFLLEIPGALIVQRWGARRWIARILLTWGFCTALVGLVHTPRQFYAARFLLGAAEAGFFPGIIVYLNQWFPSEHRARAMARFIMASPIALAIGGPMAGPILKLKWLGLSGWRWVFILEGVPALVLGVVTLYVMTDSPSQAAWLAPEERAWISGALENEQRRKALHGRFTIGQALLQPSVILLALITFLANVGIQGFFLWVPTTVEKASGLASYLSAIVSGLPFVVAVVSVLFCSWSSDRTGERFLHTAVPLILAAVIFPVTTLATQSFGWLLFWLCASSAAIYGFGPSYWVLPTMTLGESGAAAAVGLINAIGGLGGFVGPSVVGSILTATDSYAASVLFLSACFLCASIVTLILRHQSREAKPGK